MGKRPTYIQVEVPTLVKQRLEIAGEKWHSGNLSDYVRKWLYRALITDGVMTPEELALSIAGLEIQDVLSYKQELDDAKAIST